MKEKSNLVRSYGANIIVQVLSVIISYVFTIYLVRSLGADRSGLYFLSISISGIIVVVASFGFQQSTLKIFGNHFADKKWDTLFFNLKKIELFVSVISVGIIIVSFIFVYHLSLPIFKKPDLNTILYLMLLSALPLTLVRVYGGVLNGIRYHILASLTTVTFIPFFTLVLMIAYSRFSTVSLFVLGILYFCSCTAVFLIAKIFLYTKLKKHRSTINEKINFTKQIKFSFSMQGITLLSILNSSVPTIVLGILIATPSSISYYSTANKVAMLCAVPIGAMNNIIAPRIASLYQKRQIKKLSMFIQSVNFFFILAAIVMTIMLIVFSRPIMSIFGSDFIRAQNILIILVLGQFVNLSAGPVGFLLSMTSNHKLLLKIILWNTAFFTLLNIFLAYTYGVTGVAVAVSLSVCSLNIACALAVMVKLKISILPSKNLMKNYLKSISLISSVQ